MTAYGARLAQARSREETRFARQRRPAARRGRADRCHRPGGSCRYAADRRGRAPSPTGRAARPGAAVSGRRGAAGSRAGRQEAGGAARHRPGHGVPVRPGEDGGHGPGRRDRGVAVRAARPDPHAGDAQDRVRGSGRVGARRAGVNQRPDRGRSAGQATQAITSRVLLVLAAQGRVVRGRPVGSWLSQQYRWVLAGHWLRDEADEIGEVAARAELARQWLAAFGPAPLSDLKWWTGWTMAQVRRAVGDLGAAEVDLGGTAGVALPDDLGSIGDPGAWAALLPALDPTVMGWSERSWFLGPHGKSLFDTNGNAGPTIWLNGRIVGGWAQRPGGEIAIRLLEDVGAEALALVEAESQRLAAWLAGIRVIPRFRTPTERELSG